MKKYLFGDLFSGCGGLGFGFHHSKMFEPFLAVDSWSAAENVYKLNFAGASFERCDLSQRKTAADVAERMRGRVDVLLGGPPCQSFSTLGKRKDNDHRSNLVETFAEMAALIAPKIVIIENVRGITSKLNRSGQSYAKVAERILRPNYVVRSDLVDCQKLGLAQTRTRWLLIAIRKNLPDPESLLSTFWKTLDFAQKKKNRTLKDVIGDLPHVGPGEGAQKIIQRSGKRNKVIFNHKAMAHSAELVARLKCVPPGGGLLDVPDRLLNPHLLRMKAGAYGNGGHVKNIYGRLEWDRPAGTVVAGLDKITCGRFVHPTAHRLLTPRECARLQSFPDKFEFTGSMVAQYYLIGNAVPPILSKALARASLAVLRQTNSRKSSARSAARSNETRVML